MEENPVIFANGYVLTCDPSNRVGRFHVVVRDGRIQEIGGLLDVLKAMYPGATVVDVSGKLLMPGLVNAHYHSESFLVQELTSGKPFSTWAHAQSLREYTLSLFEPPNEEFMRHVMRATYAAHLKSGTTCLAEFPPSVDPRGFDLLMQSSAYAGIRTVLTLQTWDHFAYARDPAHRPARYLVGLGREEDFTVYSFENFVRVARETGIPITAHIGEQREDVELLKKNFSKAPTTLLRDFGALQPTTLLVHLNYGSSEDGDRLAESGASVVLCPLSSMIKQSGYPFLRAQARKTIRVCIGTDWGNVDVLAELRFLRDLPALFTGMPELSPLQLIRMATIDGAEALNLASEIGSIEIGKQADIIAIPFADVRRLQPDDQWSADDFSSQVLRNLLSGSPDHVMVGGRFVVRDSAFVGLNEHELIEAFNWSRNRLLPGREHGEPSPPPKPKVYSFATGERGAEKEIDGFVQGFSKGEQRTPLGQTDVQPGPDVPEKPLRESVDQTRGPEKNGYVHKVFGDDDVE